MPDFTLADIKKLPSLPAEDALSKGLYVIRATGEETICVSEDQKISSKIWFKSNPLQIQTIRRFESIQLLAESHDQGTVSDENQGNWTWFELAIFDGEASNSPRFKDGVELVWRSHRNRFQTTSYDWKEGQVFEKNSNMLRLMEDGNILAIRLCARFPGWNICAKAGYLLIDVGEVPVYRKPLEFGGLVSEVKTLQDTFHEINKSNNTAFLPELPETLFRADALSNAGDRPIRVLSLDGGGVRGLASLHMLKAVMEKAAPNKKPCQVFDMIGGTSTGGLIAIMLGRLKLTVDQCIDKYMDIMNDVFERSWVRKGASFLWNGELYDATILEKKIKQVIQETLNTDPEEVLLFDEDQSCRIFCMAVQRDGSNTHSPVFLRSYKNPHEISLLPGIKLWEAARATSAAPAYFTPIRVGTYELVDGGLQANNPLGWLWTEVLSVFGPSRVTDCFLSVGTGIGENASLSKPGLLGSHEVEKGFAGIATNTQITHILFKALLNAFAPEAKNKKYWRLNIGTEIPEHIVPSGRSWFGLGANRSEVVHDDSKPVGDLDDIVAVKQLVERAKSYIQEQSKIIDECAKALSSHLK